MRKLVLGALVLVAAGGLAWHWTGGTGGLVEAALPEFPELPEPRERLAAADRSGVVHFRTGTPFDLDVILAGRAWALPTTGIGTLFVPPAANAAAPVPGMIVVHGSGGITPGRELEYGELLAASGYAALVIDYYTPRGASRDTPYMLRVLSITEFDALTDAYAARRLLASHPAVDPERIGIVGFSYGGMAVRLAMDARVQRALAPGEAPFAAYVDYYGPCFQVPGTRETVGGPLLTLRGTEDASNDLEACRRREDELAQLGVEVEAHVFEGAGHAWEADTPRELHADSPYVVGCEIVYDAAGRAFVHGRPLLDLSPEATRAERIAERVASGGALGDCVRSGYVIGRDDATRRETDRLLLDFLARTLRGERARDATAGSIAAR